MISNVILLCSMLLCAPSTPADKALDAFMREVLDGRDAMVEFFTEHESVEEETLTIRGRLEDSPLRTFTFRWFWQYVDETLVRFPDRINRVRVSEDARQKYRDAFVAQSKSGQAYRDTTGLFFLFDTDFTKGRFLYAGERDINGRNAMAVEYFPDPTNDVSAGDSDEKDTLATWQIRRAMFFVDAESRQILRLHVSLDSFRFNDVDELELLPGFISERLDFFEFDDVEFVLDMHLTKAGICLPETIHATGNKRRTGYNLRVELTKQFSGFRRAGKGEASR